MKDSSRRLAIDWWNKLSLVEQKELMIGHFKGRQMFGLGQFKGRKIFSLTGREIEIIWKSQKETKND